MGINPKINNIQLGYASAKYELFMISDSGVRSKYFYYLWNLPKYVWLLNLLCLLVKDDTLIDMVQHLKEDVGLIHQMPFVCDRDGFPATLEKVKKSTQQQWNLFPTDLF